MFYINKIKSYLESGMRIQVKSVASSISTTFNWTLAFLVTKFFSNMVIISHFELVIGEDA